MTTIKRLGNSTIKTAIAARFSFIFRFCCSSEDTSTETR